MLGWPSRQGRTRNWVLSQARLRVIALATVITWCAVICVPSVAAMPMLRSSGVPAPKMYGYAAGPAQHLGTAAGKPHYVSAAATQAHPAAGSIKGHSAPVPDLAPPAMGTRALVTVGSAKMARGHEVAHHQDVTAAPATNPASTNPASTNPSATPSATPSPSASPSASAVPSPSPSPAAAPSSSTATTTGLVAASGTDNASYSVASTYDTVPMANQSGRIAVTLTNTGTSTWGSGNYALGTQVFSSSDTTGTGTPLTTGTTVAISTTVPPGASLTVEGITPAESPGSYTLCWDMLSPSGQYFSDEGGNEYCAPYTIQQYAAVVNEQEPLPGTDVDSQTPQLSASATVPGGYPAVPAFSFAFQIISGPDARTATVLQSSGWVANNGNSWTPTALTWGNTYYWQVTVTDAATQPPLSGPGITWTTPITFVVGNAQPTVTYRFGNNYQADDGNPVMTSDLGSTDYTGSGKTVDPKTANVAQQITDASVNAVGPPLSIVRTYNSLDPRTSQATGAGWSSSLDMSLVPDPDGSGALILTLADGQQVRFAKNAAGGYAPPQDKYAVVSALSGGGFAVKDQSGTTYSFGQASGSSWLISQVTDASGRSETFTYSSGALTTITSTTSGRALHLTWTTPSGATYPHMASVSTDPVSAGQSGTAFTWTYGYSGDLLTSVCPPGTTTVCTKYAYTTNGSHAPTSVLNANPTSYYRLDDPASATVAANQIPVNDLTTMDPPASEFNTALGVAGPVQGVTATGFNGTSSFIPLDGAWCTTPGQVSSCIQSGDSGRILGGPAKSLGVSLWFKTTLASGVLMSLSPALPGSSTSGYGNEPTSLLQIASNGDLQGYGTCGTTCSWMSSTAPVNDGAWHQAVLIPGQALYLDGKEVATFTTGHGSSAGLPTAAAVLLGTGEILNQNTGSYEWSYFNGSMADLSIYQNQLPSVGTVAAQYAAETHQAAELSSVTSPGGRTELSATYDTVNDRVATLTDAHGGTWAYGSPVPGSSSAAYGDAVLGSSPEDFWPLSDSSGPLAHDMVGGSATAASARPAATYANVTLGAAGPTGFPDGTAASFSGSGSQISVPGGYFAGNGAESVELWFQTTTAGGTLLSTNTGTGGNPPTLWIDSGGCLNGSIGSTQLGTFLGGCAPLQRVNDGKWHQVILSLSPITTSNGLGSGTESQAAYLYLDGVQLYTAPITIPATLSSTGYVAYVGNGADGDFTGSIADVSIYTRELTSSEVSGHYTALHNQVSVSTTSGHGQTTTIATPTLNTQTIAITDPVNKNADYTYATGNLVRTVDVLGGVTYYGYDSANRASTITNPDGDTTYTTHDAHNNVTSTTTCAAVNNCQTAYTSYYENLATPLDPRNDRPTDSRDARSSSPSDPAFDTVTTYTATAQIASIAKPPTSACPSGCKTTYAYTAGTEAAVGGGTEPAGLVASITAPGGGMTSYEYNSAGDVMQTTSPLGLVSKYTYDNLGRQVAQTQVSDTYPAGLTTSYTYDGQDRVLTETAPPITDRVTGAVHTKVTSYTYDPDDDVLTTTVSDTTGGDPSRTTTDTYDTHGNLASTQDSLGNTTSYTYDGLGDRITQTNPAGTTTAYTYDAAGNLLTTTLDGYTGNPSAPIAAENLVEESRAYDPAGRLASVINGKGVTTNYTYFGNNQMASSYVVDTASSTGRENVHTYSYDAAGNRTSETAPGGLVTNTAYDAGNHVISQTADPAGVNRTTTATYDADGNIVAESLTGGGVTQTETMTYNAMDQVLSQTTDNTGSNLTTNYKRDQRGLVISQTDPAGNITTFSNDEDGRAVVKTAPAVASQTGNGAAPVTAAPVTMTGYDTFGDTAEISDANGNITRYAYDQDGHQTSINEPSYTPPGSSGPVNGTTSATYNNLGLEASETDPLGNTTKFGYDQLGDEVSRIDPGGGLTISTYDPAGEQTSVTDPTGAQTQTTYDNLGQVITTTELVRQNTSAAYTTTYAYDDAGNQISQTSPTGVVTKATFDALGERTSATDGAGNTTTYAYNLDGAQVKATLPDGTATTATYDLAGRQTALSSLDATGVVLRTETAAYNLDSQVTSSIDYRGNTATYNYDATGMLTSQVEPVASGQSITLSYGYDLAGHQTAVTNGNLNTTYTTYNSRGLPETITEPPTSAYSSAADSTTTNIYDANGDLVTQNLPGGEQLSSSYDPMGDLKSQSGSGASAPTATRGFSYDAAGRILTATTTAAGTQGTSGYQAPTSESFNYDDRGLLLSASGSAGTTVYNFNGSGQMTSAADAAGTSSYTYNSAGQLATDAAAASGATGTYSYNKLGQVSQISYGTGSNTQSFGYDSLHRITSDTVATSGGTQVAAIGYGYNANNDVTSMTTSGLATPGGGSGTVTNTYGYDQANRMTSWTATPSGGTATSKTYGYDNNGNLVNNNGTTYTYDARDELTSDGSSAYTYTAAGDMASQVSGSGTTYSFSSDAFGQQVTDAVSSFTWDAMGRLVSAGNQSGSSIALTYEGATNEVASDSSASYSRDPAGGITGVDSASGGKLVALVNGHEDLSGTFAAGGTSLSGSTMYDPWGQVLAAAGPSVQVGYQGQWTDPGTGQTDMGARMYKPGTGGFLNQDTAPAAAGDNLHAYVNDNPMTLTDVSGHSPSSGGGSGGGSITAGQVAAAVARAGVAHAKAAAAVAAAGAAKAASLAASAAAHAAVVLARTLNDAAAKLAELAAAASRLAAAAFKAAQAKLREAESWQAKADAEFRAAAEDVGKALHSWPWDAATDLWDAAKAGAAGALDEARAVAAFAEYAVLEGAALALQGVADLAHGAAKAAALAAKGADKAAQFAGKVADVAARASQTMTAIMYQAEAQAAQADAVAAHLTAAYAAQEARKLKALAKAALRGLKKAGHVIGRVAGHAAVAVAKAAYKYSGAQDVVSCVTHPSLAGCAKAAMTVALTVGTDGLGGIAAHVGEAGLEAAGEKAAGEVVGSVAERAGASCGLSFTASTKVLLANGKAVPISSLKPGQKVLATNTKTGTTRAEAIAAVMVNHDTDLYDLKITAAGRTGVIHTTSNHPFWDQTSRRWVKAGALKYGTRLRTPAGGTATVTGGWTPKITAGWMWDLTIPGDHDFYVIPATYDRAASPTYPYHVESASIPVLVHNCGDIPFGPATEKVQGILDRIRAKGAPLPGYKGGSVFGNTDRILPELDAEGNQITYREWDVNPNIQGVVRGAERLVTGSDGSAYHTGNHYRSFLQIP